MAPRKTNMTIKVKLKGERTGPFAKGFGSLHAFARLPHDPEKVIGKAKFNAKGEANIKITLPGRVAPPVEVEVSPISKPVNVKNIKTEKSIISKFSKKRGGAYEANMFVDINERIRPYSVWLEQDFTVSGKLLSHYVDAETDADCITPVPYSKVTLFDVDKFKSQIPCLVDCEVSCFVCTPTKVPFCTPDFEIPICPPDIEEIEICPPDCGPCVPWVIMDGRCGPWVMDIDIHDKRIKHLKKGFAKSMKKSVAVKSASPIKSPALSLVPYSNSGVGGSGLSKCGPMIIDGCFPNTCNVIFAKKKYVKHELGFDETDVNGNYSITFKRKDFFESVAGGTQTENVDWDEYPDLLFEASRFFDGEMRAIYEEDYDQTRWDITSTCLKVNLIIEGQVPGVECNPSEDLDPSQTEDLVFHGIGDVEPGWIDSNGIINNAPASKDLDEHVFGGTLDILGQFKYTHIGKYYQVEYANASDPNDWKPIANETWTYSKYLGNFQWETLTKSPVDLGGDLTSCYEIPNYLDHYINRKTHLIVWRTWRKDGNIARYPNGQYKIRVRLVDDQGDPVPGYDPDNHVIPVTLDNTWPEADIMPEVRVYDKGAGPGIFTEIPECGSVQSADRYLVFNFIAYDHHKHFRYYNFKVNRGAENPVSFTTVHNAKHSGPDPVFTGIDLKKPYKKFTDPNENYPDNYTWLYIGKDYWDEATYGSFRPCAYNFTLTVGDRVTNGKHRIHLRHATLTLTIT